ncbi:MAG: hypothetical protein DME09_02255 [Candidatus Rokuibacteriota bacterium]|nr:MAG: hypothetical protein DME09_02255 [Candidatus Rokubacteria bacterium]
MASLFWKISNGRGAMPAWETFLPKDRWRLRYIRTVADQPAVGSVLAGSGILRDQGSKGP